MSSVSRRQFFAAPCGPYRLWGHSRSFLTLRTLDPVGVGAMRATEGGGRPREVVLRPTLGADHYRVEACRDANRDWLKEWEATLPLEAQGVAPGMTEYIRRFNAKQRHGEALLMMVEIDGEVVGQVSLTNVSWGASRMGMLGYWLASDYAGRGLGSFCVARVLDLVIGELGLHRVEICVRPENERSLGLCRSLGLIEEGMRRRYIHIGTQWADHIAFVADVESMPTGGWVKVLNVKSMPPC